MGQYFIMNILYLIHSQLLQIRKLMKEELSRGQYCVNYRICETDHKLLNKNDLVKYLIETPIHSTKFLEDINALIIEIIDLWNNDFQKIEHKLLEENFFYCNEEKGQLLSARFDFHCILLKDEKWHHFNSTDTAKIHFLEKYENNHYQLADIIFRSAAILDLIVLHYPETFKDEKIVPITIQEKIEEIFLSIDEKGWQYVFFRKEDHDNLLNLLTQHFTGKPIKIPEAVIPLKRKCKTRLALILKELHNEFSTITLTKDAQFFEILRRLSSFSQEANLYKTISR